MKRLVIELLLLFAFISAVFALLEYGYRNYESATDKILIDFYRHKEDADVLLVGNSHSLPLYNAVKKSDSTSLACLAIGGDDLFWMQALVKRHLHEMKVSYLILNCDDELLGFNQSISGLQYMNRILYRYADTMYGNNRTDILLSKSNFFRSNRDLGYLFNQGASEKMIGVEAAAGAGAFSDEDCRSRAIEISEKRFSKKLFGENISYVESIIREAERCSVRLFILKMPKSDCLAASMNRQNLDAARHVLDALLDHHKVPVLDFTNDSSYVRKDFANPDHLTTEAAARLLQQVNEHIFLLTGERPVRL